MKKNKVQKMIEIMFIFFNRNALYSYELMHTRQVNPLHVPYHPSTKSGEAQLIHSNIPPDWPWKIGETIIDLACTGVGAIVCQTISRSIRLLITMRHRFKMLPKT